MKCYICDKHCLCTQSKSEIPICVSCSTIYRIATVRPAEHVDKSTADELELPLELDLNMEM